MKTRSGNVIKRHVDQLRFRRVDTEDVDSSEDFEDLFDDWKIHPSSPLVPNQTPVATLQVQVKQHYVARVGYVDQLLRMLRWFQERSVISCLSNLLIFIKYFGI